MASFTRVPVVAFIVIAALVALDGCYSPHGAWADVDSRVRPLDVWAHAPELEVAAKAAAKRIEIASGLEVSVNRADSMPSSRAIFWTTSLAAEGMLGRQTDSGLPIDETTPANMLESIVLHELLHELGAGHLPDTDFLMSEVLYEPQPIRTRDLVELCDHADCTTFQPEQL